MNAAEPLIEAWAEGYSGKAGVPGLKKSSQGLPRGVGVDRSKVFADRGDRPPEAVPVFGIPAGDDGVGHGDIQQSKEVNILVE